MANGTGSVTQQDVYREIMQSVRHYSVLRFTMIPIFLTASGAFITAYGANEPLISPRLIALAGIQLSIIFVLFEIALSANLALLWRAAAALVGKRFKPAFAHRIGILLWPVRIAVPSVYVVGLILWIGQLQDWW